MQKTIKTIVELETEAQNFIRSVSPRQNGATLVALSGELGAGKTAFTKATAKVLGVEETITSPTFVLEKIYLLPPQARAAAGGFTRLVHIDAYRLSGAEALAPLGFDELMRDSGNLIMLEWPENVSKALSEPAVRISLAVLPDGSRAVTYG